jgi:hypothetical protein
MKIGSECCPIRQLLAGSGGQRTVRVNVLQNVFQAHSAYRWKDIDKPEEIKHFWAFVVWNYKEEKVQILEVTQKGIQKKLESLFNDADWGSPRNYDLVVTKSGEGMDTRYEVMPKVPKAIDEGIVKLYEDMHITLEAL